jgi:hypothetical protein
MAAPTVVSAAHWAVIVAGSNGYSNYRRQADACHAYQVMKNKGIPESNIITMMYDDIAHNSENPFPGKIFNAPDPDGLGVNVYEGCKIDYKGKDVNVHKYIGIITGTGSGKVLKSNADDHVFLNFIDHGAPGIVAFADTVMHASKLHRALATMHRKKMYKQLLFYLETCESGSMFEGLSVPGVYAVSAANPTESSWGTYCSGTDDRVNGTSLSTCLGDLFSVNWMQNADKLNMNTETLEQQYDKVKVLTARSHVLQWGDLNFTSDPVAAFFGGNTGGLTFAPKIAPRNHVSAHKATFHRLYSKYESADSSRVRLYTSQALQEQLKKQDNAEAVHWRLAELAYPGDAEAQHAARTLTHKPKHPECEVAGHEAIRENCSDQFDANSGWALKFHQVVVNICHDIAYKGLNLMIEGAAAQACGKDAKVKQTVVV